MNAATARKPLTAMQAKILAFMVEFLAENDQLPPPSLISVRFGLSPKTGSMSRRLGVLEANGYLQRNILGRLMLADRPERTVPLTGKQRLYLASAWAMLEDYAQGQRMAGNDSIADGAIASAHEIKQLLAPVFIGVDLATGPDQTAMWDPTKGVAHG